MPIRPMNFADIPAVLQIQAELSFQDWNERQYEQEIKAPYTYAVVYEKTAPYVVTRYFTYWGPIPNFYLSRSANLHNVTASGASYCKPGFRSWSSKNPTVAF